MGKRKQAASKADQDDLLLPFAVEEEVVDAEDDAAEDLVPEGKLVCVLTGEYKTASPQEETLQSFIEQLHRNFSITPGKVPPGRLARNDSAKTKHRAPDPAFKPPRRRLGQAAARPPLPSGESDPPAAGSDPGRARDLEDTPRS